MAPTGDAAEPLLGSISGWLSSLRLADSPLVVVALVTIVAILLWLTLRLSSHLRYQRRTIRSLNSKLHGQHVRRGYASEALAPLLKQFPVAVGKPGTTTLFVGQPVDYLHFDEREGVTFIEIKSGKSTLSSRQKRLRDLVGRGQVRWVTMNVDAGTGTDD